MSATELLKGLSDKQLSDLVSLAHAEQRVRKARRAKLQQPAAADLLGQLEASIDLAREGWL